VVASVLAPAGCRTMNKGITETILDGSETGHWHIRYGSQSFYRLNDEGLKQIEFEGLVDAGRIRVRYQRGMEVQARYIADTTAGLLRQIEQRVGVPIGTSSTIDLLRFDEPPQSFDIQLTVEPNEFPLPLFVRAGDESCTSILTQNRSYPYILVHELVETSLARRRGSRVLPDLTWGPFGLHASLNNYTRWFRDGLANYAGYVACRIVSDEMDCPECPTRVAAVLHARPFSQLAGVGTRLFSWPQSSHSERERDYYNAALGVFLLIEERFGQQSIRDIVAEIGTRESVDGQDLREIVNGVIGTDIRQLVADFEFPLIGGELTPVTAALAANKGLDVVEGLVFESIDPNGPADRAGLMADDVIVATDSAPVAGALDFELALLRAGRRPTIQLAVWRRNAGTIEVELPLQWPDKGTRPPGKRHNPLKKGRIDVFSILPFIP
jgi:hypothetical protein